MKSSKVDYASGCRHHRCRVLAQMIDRLLMWRMILALLFQGEPVEKKRGRSCRAVKEICINKGCFIMYFDEEDALGGEEACCSI